jgi:hypothetical protein
MLKIKKTHLLKFKLKLKILCKHKQTKAENYRKKGKEKKTNIPPSS